jgi:hypothetical protein
MELVTSLYLLIVYLQIHEVSCCGRPAWVYVFQLPREITLCSHDNADGFLLGMMPCSLVDCY